MALSFFRLIHLDGFRTKKDVREEFVDYIMDIMQELLEDKNYDDFFLIEFVANLRRLLIAIDQFDEGIATTLLKTILFNRSFESACIRHAALEYCCYLSKRELEISLPCASSALPILFSVYVHEDSLQDASFWWPIYSYEYILELYVGAFIELYTNTSSFNCVRNLIFTLSYLTSRISRSSFSRCEVKTYLVSGFMDVQ